MTMPEDEREIIEFEGRLYSRPAYPKYGDNWGRYLVSCACGRDYDAWTRGELGKDYERVPSLCPSCRVIAERYEGIFEYEYFLPFSEN